MVLLLRLRVERNLDIVATYAILLRFVSPIVTQRLGMGPSANSYDYIVVGGGIAGICLSSRLSQLLPASCSDDKRILLLEAGSDPSIETEKAKVLQTAMTSFAQQYSPQWGYQVTTEPNKNLNGRSILAAMGKGLGGGGLVNGSVWTRGSRSDFDLWARIVGDESWSYGAMLPFMKKVECMAVSEENGVFRDEEQHGYDGPIKVTPTRAMWPNRKFPMRDITRKMWEEIGVKSLTDGNAAEQNGLADTVELWIEGKRQMPGSVFDLNNVQVRTGAVVEKVTFDTSEASNNPVVNGVLLTNGEHLKATKEVILCAGTIHSPQILMLSGVGDPEELGRYDIPVASANKQVGKNVVDHIGVASNWKLNHPEQGLTLGSPLFNDPTFFWGWPSDFLRFGRLEIDAKLGDLIESEADRDLLLRPDATHVENISLYAGRPKGAGIALVHDGTLASGLTILVSPTSRGSIKLKSASIKDPPAIDVNFLDTEVDRLILREGLRQMAAVYAETKTGQATFSHEVPPQGHKAILEANDLELDDRAASFGETTWHLMGGCCMKQVVDSHCRVLGARGLRVVDASVFPIPLSCHPQATVYAMAERVAQWIGNGDQ
jgi:choline dehydrogenase-like flavoprotein